ncbi:T9SS type A sorting domain-containing protein [Leeuwenhoekiella sp. LLG6367-2.1]|uniref:T9SS type A sorting domain-containing protein n=1 Tax=Leeuwenhoekiella sp. LLG6367-2.1 TaxID=3160833 RepID=UPI00386F376E
MKTTIKTLVLALVLAVSFNMNAADGIAVTINENFIVKVEYTNAIEGAQIYLEDSRGQKLFKEFAGKNANDYKTLSLEALPTGKYYLVYEDDYAKSYTSINKKNTGLDIVSDEARTIFKPNYRIQDDIILISFTNPKEVKTTTRVYDENGEVIESITDRNLVVKQALNLSGLKNGTYLVGITIGQDYFSKEIEIN